MAWQDIHMSVLRVSTTRTLPEYKGLLCCHCNTAGGSITLTIPDAADCSDIWVSKCTDDAYTVSFSGTVNGVAITATLETIGDGLMLRSNGTSWYMGNRRVTI